jgi:hypothetical protein
MSLLLRKAKITLGVLLLGFVAGSIVGTGVFAAMALRRDGIHGLDAMVLRVGLGVGGTIGALIAPALGFGWLRDVPLGRAIFSVMLWTLGLSLLGTVVDPSWGAILALVGLLAGPAWALYKR